MQVFAPKTHQISRVRRVFGEVDDIAPDKSISHRCVIFSLLSEKPSCIKNFLYAEDTMNSLKIAQTLGVEVESRSRDFAKKDLILKPPKFGIQDSAEVLDCGNSGTTMRIYTGLLAGIKGNYILNGDSYLQKRPMDRVIHPLRDMGARIHATADTFAPIHIQGHHHLRSFTYHSPIPSAQVKTAMILAGLHVASGESLFSEEESSRDHSEKMLLGMGADLKIKDNQIHISPIVRPLQPLDICVPADPSSAFFLAVAAAILPGSEILLKNVLLNPKRIEAFKILEKMGVDISYEICENSYESVGNIYVKQNELNGIEVNENMAWLIDEIPALSIAMACAVGKSRVRNAKELRIKECDRIKAISTNLRAMNIECIEYEDGFEIQGGEMQHARIHSFGDHRIAMSFAIAGLLCGVEIEDFSCIHVSFPNLLDILQKICVKDG